MIVEEPDPEGPRPHRECTDNGRAGASDSGEGEDKLSKRSLETEEEATLALPRQDSLCRFTHKKPRLLIFILHHKV